MDINQKDFGQGAQLFTLVNDHGVTLEATNFGARIVHLFVTLESGEQRNLVLGFDSVDEYLNQDVFFGATIGRVAGRIAKGKFSIDGTDYQADTDPTSGNTLHGGKNSLETKIWQASTKQEENQVSVIFDYKSAAGENGFPGTLSIRVIYTLTNEDEWFVTYEAVTDQATLFNPTNHVYFNLTGDVEQTVAEHELFVLSDTFVVVDEQTLPTGEFRKVENTPFDFRELKPVAQVFDVNYQQNQLVNGLDHPFLLKNEEADVVKAILVAPDKDVSIEMYTDQPAVVIFTAQFGEDGPFIQGKKMASHGGITLETQVSPGALDYKELGSIIVKPNELFYSRTTYKIVY